MAYKHLNEYLKEAKELASKLSGSKPLKWASKPLKWWIVTGADGEPCGRIDAATMEEAKRKATSYWSPKKVTIKQQTPSLVKPK